MARADAAPVAHPAASAEGLIGVVGAHLGPQLLIQAPLGLLDALVAVPRNRLRVRCPLGLQALLGVAQPRPPALAAAPLLGQLVAARLAVEFVLGGVGRDRLLDELARDLLVIEVLVA